MSAGGPDRSAAAPAPVPTGAGSMSLRLHKSLEATPAPFQKKTKKEKEAGREQDGVCAGQGEHKHTFNFPGRFSSAGPLPEGCASFPNVSPDGAEAQFVLGPVTACLGTAGWRRALAHIDNHTVMLIVINHLCHGSRAQRSRMG